jgi:2-polyprenyl-6-methoxyphenol hydroxylase-like FAD-dependent oxidoreductase
VRVIVIGGGVAGLGVALALSRDGHEVVVLESDATPLPESSVEAFEHWDRRGAPQVWHSHAFLSRLRNLLLAHAPDVREALLAHGAYELEFGESLPPTIRDFRPEPGDEELVLLACRRITFEWVLRRIVQRNHAVTWRGAVRVEGLVAGPASGTGIPRVTGVVARGEAGVERLDADLVVDASGRRSRLPAWLTQIGGGNVEQEEEDCGIFYCSRFYRLRPGASPPPGSSLIGADLGYMKYAIFPGDSGIFSVTLAASPEDAPLRAILHREPFEAAAGALPVIRDWVDPQRAEPITPIRAMGSLRNRRRSFVCDGAPVALGVHAIGDAAIHTNPLYGRGCALAFVHAYLLLAALREHGDDAESCARALHEATRREIVPWYRAARDQDREAREVAAAEQRGEGIGELLPSQPGRPVDPRAFMRSVLRDGLLPALRTDAVVLRTFVRSFNLLAAPDALITDPEVFRRILAVWQDRDARSSRDREGPPREQMLQVLERAA